MINIFIDDRDVAKYSTPTSTGSTTKVKPVLLTSEKDMQKKGTIFQKNFTEHFKHLLGPHATELAEKYGYEMTTYRTNASKIQEQIDEMEKIMETDFQKSVESDEIIKKMNEKAIMSGEDMEKREKAKNDKEKAEKRLKDYGEKMDKLKKSLKEAWDKFQEKARILYETTQKNFRGKPVSVEKGYINYNEQRIEDFEEKSNDTSLSQTQREEASKNAESLRLVNEETRADVREREGSNLKEKIMEIFKKHGVTVFSVLLAAGVTIDVVISAIKAGLKNLGQKVGKGLKDLGKETAKILPGLIGSIVGFIFRTAGSVVGFLAQNTWLLILAAVAFLMQKQSQKSS